MTNLRNKKILLGICGGIAAYKSAFLVRELTRQGADVRVVMTKAAEAFITPLTLQALSGNEVRSALFDSQAERAMSHIELARWADLVLIAPASANMMAKLAQGLADDLLSTLYLVAEVPVFICPAMNHSMWSHPATQANYELLLRRGAVFIGPEAGMQACQEEGMGRMSEVPQIIAALAATLMPQSLAGKTVLITAGPTREAIDPVRYISNHSSGKMGYALAEAAVQAGAAVILISGPTALTPPSGVNYLAVESAKEMYDEVLQQLKPGMVYIGTAAVADYHTLVQPHKLKKQDNPCLTLELMPNPDILATVAASGKAAYVVGFAAETQSVKSNAAKKLYEKKIDMIIANQVGVGLGFDQDDNEVLILTKTDETHLPRAAKVALAHQIIAILALNLQNAPSS